MWKKSERHEYFTQQATRLSRKKFSLQSGSMYVLPGAAPKAAFFAFKASITTWDAAFSPDLEFQYFLTSS